MGTRRSFRGLAAACVLSLAGVGLAGCAQSAPDPQTLTLTIGVVGAGSGTFDAVSVGLFDDLPVEAVYEGLLKRDEDVEQMTPWLAESFEVSDDLRTMTFQIRHGVSFTDGEVLDAEAVKRNLDFRANDEASALYGTFEPQDVTVEVTGQYEVTLTARGEPMDYRFQTVFNDVPIASPVALENREALALAPVGTGPYIFDEETSVVGVEYRYTRNLNHWDSDAYPYDTLVLKIYEDPIAAWNALQSGQVDVTEIDPSVAAVADESGFATSVGSARFRTLVFNTANLDAQPAIGDPRVRTAINMAFDRASIAEALDYGLGRVTGQGFSEGQREYVEGADDYYPYDLEAAKELMVDAGYADGFDLTIPMNNSWEDWSDMEPIVEQSLADLNIRVTFESYVDAGEFLAANSSAPVGALNNYYDNTLYFVLDPFFANILDPKLTGMVSAIRYGTPDASAQASEEIGPYVLEQAYLVAFSAIPTTWASNSDISVKIPPITGIPELYMILPSS